MLQHGGRVKAALKPDAIGQQQPTFEFDLPLTVPQCIIYVLSACARPPYTAARRRRWMQALVAARACGLYIPAHLNHPKLRLAETLAVDERGAAMYFYMHPSHGRPGTLPEHIAMERVRGLRVIHPYPLADVARAAHEHLRVLAGAASGKKYAEYCHQLLCFLTRLQLTHFDVDWMEAMRMCHTLESPITALVFYQIPDFRQTAAVLMFLVYAPCSFGSVFGQFAQLLQNTPCFQETLSGFDTRDVVYIRHICQTFAAKYALKKPCSTCRSAQLFRQKHVKRLYSCDCEDNDAEYTPARVAALVTCSRILSDADIVLSGKADK
jgi:hypothetical protein